jgi:hypothetical protein
MRNAMTKEMLRDKSLDWFEQMMNSKIQERITWGVTILCVSCISTVYLVRHF